MTTVGADAEALDRAAGVLNSAADELDAHCAGLHGTLTGVSWLGVIATRFLALFEGQHQPKIRTTAGFVRDAATKLQLQAEQQRAASNSLGAAVTHSPFLAGATDPGGGDE